MITKDKKLISRSLKFFLFFFFVGLTFFINTNYASAAICHATETSNWSTGVIWVGCSGAGGKPGAGDDVYIDSGVTITMDENSALLGNITISGGGILNTTTSIYSSAGYALSGTTITVDGTLIANASTITLYGGSGTLFTKGTEGTFTAGASTVSLISGIGTSTIASGSPSFNNLTLSSQEGDGIPTKILGENLILTGDLIINDGTLDTLGYNITARRITIADVTTAVLTANNSTINLTGVFVLGNEAPLFGVGRRYSVFNAGTSTINISGNGNATIFSNRVTVYNLISSGTGQKNLGASISIAENGGLSLLTSNGIFNPLGYQVTGNGNNILSVANGATLKVEVGAFSGNYDGFTIKTFTSGSIVNYSGTGSQTIDSSLEYSNLTISGSGTKTLGGNTTVGNILTIETGTTLAGGDWDLNLSGTTGSPFVVSGSFQAGTGSVTYSGNNPAGNTNILNLSYYDLTVNNASETYVLAGTTTGNSSGTLTVANGTLNTNGQTLTIGRISIANSASAVFVNSGTLNLNGTSGTLFTKGTSGTFTDAVGVSLTGNGNAVINSGNIIFLGLISSGTGVKTLGAQITIVLNGGLIISNGIFDPLGYHVYGNGNNTLTVANGATLRVGASTFVQNYSSNFLNMNLGVSSIIEYSGDIDQKIVSTILYPNLTIGGSRTKSLEGDTTIVGALGINNNTLDTQSQNLEFTNTGDISPGSVATSTYGFESNRWETAEPAIVSDDTYAANSIKHQFYNTDLLYFNSFGFNIHESATIRGIKVSIEARSTRGSGSFYDRVDIIDGDGNVVTDRINRGDEMLSDQDTINNFGGADSLFETEWTPAMINGGYFGFRVTFSSGENEGDTILVDSASVVIYYNLNSLATYNLSAGSINIDGTGVLNANTSSLILNGTSGLLIDNRGTLNASNSTIYLNGNGNTNIASGVSSMGTLIINNGGTKSLFENLTANNIIITSGILDTTSANNYTINAGVINVTGGTFNPQASTINLTGVGNVFVYGSGTIIPGESTIKLTDATSTTKIFAGGSQTYNNIWMAGGGNYQINGSNTFKNFKVDNPPHVIYFNGSSTTTVESLTVSGTPGNLNIFKNTSDGKAWTINDASGQNILDYVSIQDSIATGGATFQALNSINLGSNMGWIFGIERHAGGKARGGNDLEIGVSPGDGIGGGGIGGGGGIVLPLCSDTIDNDVDGLIDTLDPNCHLDGNLQSEYVPTHNSETTSPISNTGGGQGGGGGDLGYFINNIYTIINRPFLRISHMSLLGLVFSSLYNF